MGYHPWPEPKHQLVTRAIAHASLVVVGAVVSLDDNAHHAGHALVVVKRLARTKRVRLYLRRVLKNGHSEGRNHHRRHNKFKEVIECIANRQDADNDDNDGCQATDIEPPLETRFGGLAENVKLFLNRGGHTDA